MAGKHNSNCVGIEDGASNPNPAPNPNPAALCLFSVFSVTASAGNEWMVHEEEEEEEEEENAV